MVGCGVDDGGVCGFGGFVSWEEREEGGGAGFMRVRRV